MQNLSRLSLNQKTTDRWGVREAVAGCVAHGIPAIALWRDKVEMIGVPEAAKIVCDAGLKVSSLCRGGAFPATTAVERGERLDDNRRAIADAAALGTDLLVLVCGPAAGKDLPKARAQVAEGIAALAPFAVAHGVRLGIEALHPSFAGSRSVVVTLAEALDLADHINQPNVGVVIDTYHTWWDPYLYDEITRARGRIFGFHVNDWLEPNRDPLVSRGMMGDGVIEIRRIREAVDATGYDGPIEVEIFNETIWATPGNEVLPTLCARYLSEV